MQDIEVSLVTLAALLAGAWLGHELRRRLPPMRLTRESAATVKLMATLLAALAVLVLGFLISSAKSTLDTVRDEVTQNASRVQRLGAILRDYGPEAAPLHASLERQYADFAALLDGGRSEDMARLGSHDAMRAWDDMERGVLALHATDATQRQLQREAIDLADQIAESYWNIVLKKDGSLSPSLMLALIAWFVVIFGVFGLLAAPRPLPRVTLVLGALLVALAIPLILEMDLPLDGSIRVSPAPLPVTMT
jgi:hypothetical protein